MKYGERLRNTPIAMSTVVARRSLLGDSGMDVEVATDSDFTPYATTVVSVSGASPVPAAPPSSEALSLEPGTVLEGRYRVVRRVGKGGFGIAILVEDMVVNEEIILKFLHASLAADARLIKGFIRELRYARKITHENVIRIYDFLSIGGAYAISMEYFPSHTLSSEALPLPIPRGLNIIGDIAGQAMIANNLGGVLKLQDDIDAAIVEYQRSLAILRESAGPHEIARTLVAVAALAPTLGRRAEGQAAIAEALPALRDVGARRDLDQALALAERYHYTV
jgi:hypothetical protein